MSSIVHSDLRVQGATNFIRQFGFNTTTLPTVKNQVYIAIGKSTEWTDDTIADPTVGSYDEEYDTVDGMWDEILGLHLVDKADFSHVVRRINWETGVTYPIYDTSMIPANLDSLDYYAYVETTGEVWECTTSTGASTDSPNKTSTGGTYVFAELTGGVFTANDGNVWKYLYTIAPVDQDKFLATAWIPVNWNESSDFEEDNNYGIDAIDPSDPLYVDHEYNIRKLRSRFVMVRALLEDTDLDFDYSYRKVAIISNPLADDGSTRLTTSDIVQADIAANVTVPSGDLLYIEHRVPIYRVSGQNELVRLVLEY